jgi:hypothetical protein
MAIITEYSWKDDTWTHHGEHGTRAAWRAAVAEIAARAKQTLPEANGRVDKAVALVLNGDVELLAAGKARVASQSNGLTEYVTATGHASAKTSPRRRVRGASTGSPLASRSEHTRWCRRSSVLAPTVRVRQCSHSPRRHRFLKRQHR